MNTPTVEQVSAAAGIVASLYGGWRVFLLPKVVHPCRQFAHQVSTALVAVDEIRAFLGPNGGSSLGDMIHATHVRTERIEDEIQVPLFEVRDDRMVRINACFERTFGYAPDDVRDKQWIRLLHQSDRDPYLREWKFAQEDKRLFEQDARYIANNGTVHRVRVTIEPRAYGSNTIRWFGRIVVLAVEAPKGAAQ